MSPVDRMIFVDAMTLLAMVIIISGGIIANKTNSLFPFVTSEFIAYGLLISVPLYIRFL